MSHTVEDLWNERLDHDCEWLEPYSPIPVEDRSRYKSIRPIRPVVDNYWQTCQRPYVWKHLDHRVQPAFRPWYRRTLTCHWYQVRAWLKRGS